MPGSDQETLTILYTNDVHSHFEAMGHIARMVDEMRAELTGPILLLDIGDHMDRAARETEGTLGRVNVDVLNLMGYDAVTIGNNEGLTFTLDMLRQAYANLECPVVCGNILEKRTGHPPEWMKAQTILTKNGFTVGLAGATAAFADYYDQLGLEALDPVETIAEQVRQLRGQVDLVVVLSHLGLPLDRELAKSVPGIDLIIGGHTHHLLEVPLMIGSTAITAAGKYGHYLGKITIRKNRTTGRPFHIEGCCMAVGDGPGQDKALEVIARGRREADVRLGTIVAVTERELPLRYSEESPFGNLLAQAVRRYTGCDLSLVNSGQLLAGLPAGEITEGMLHERCPSPINPCRMTIKGEDIVYSLEESLIPEITERAIFGFGFRGKVLGGICTDGLEIVYNPEGPPYRRIVQATAAGVPITAEAMYSVGTLDMFSFGIGYERLKNGIEKQFMLQSFLREVLRMELWTEGAVESSIHPRWKIVHP